MLSFDQLMDDTYSQVERIVSFCDISPQRDLEEVVNNCSFNQLQEVEKIHGRVHENSKINFFRSGDSGQWKSEFSQQDLDYVMTDEVLNLYEQLNLKP